MENGYSYFKNTECEYFPCHKTECEEFNCLFCYCPLYALGDKCGGRYTYTENGIKDCSKCLIPHSKDGYSYVLSKLADALNIAEEKKTTNKA
ncbi:MAG: cysteine-rich small domain-containing protein [Clostridia bacterium]|nr:cysteine-rich small domain-containing protein [Clostridia bacterium]